jgi:hypothetical protein
MLLLIVSACLSSLEMTVENRLFQIEPELSAIGLQSAVAVWKMIFCMVTILFAKYIPVSVNVNHEGKMENFTQAVKEISQD